jgi:hypothetical protein
MGQLRGLGVAGDTRIDWDPYNEEEVRLAKKYFDEARAKNFNAYRVRGDGKPGDVITTFDRHAEKIIIAPPVAGG